MTGARAAVPSRWPSRSLNCAGWRTRTATFSGTTGAGTTIPARPLSRWRGGAGRAFTTRRHCRRCWSGGGSPWPPASRSTWCSRSRAMTACSALSSHASSRSRMPRGGCSAGSGPTPTLARRSEPRKNCAAGRRAVRGRPPQGRVPGDAGPRAAQPAGPAPQRPANHAAVERQRRRRVEQARTMMERQVGQMVRLVDDLLDVSRISRGKLELRKERVELAAVVQQRRRNQPPAHRASGHELDGHACRPSPVFVDADVTRLAQVFANLLNNAAKYTERGGHIWLTAERQGSEVRGERQGHRRRHPARHAAADLRHVHAGRSVAGAVAGRPGHRPDAGEAAGRDARRQRRGPQRGPRPGQRVRRPPAGGAVAGQDGRTPAEDGRAGRPPRPMPHSGGGRQPDAATAWR